MLLHIINNQHINQDSDSTSMLNANDGNALLLIEDGVYLLAKNPQTLTFINDFQSAKKLYALTHDVHARGIKLSKDISVELIDDIGFVELTEQYSRVITW